MVYGRGEGCVGGWVVDSVAVWASAAGLSECPMHLQHVSVQLLFRRPEGTTNLTSDINKPQTIATCRTQWPHDNNLIYLKFCPNVILFNFHSYATSSSRIYTRNYNRRFKSIISKRKWLNFSEMCHRTIIHLFKSILILYYQNLNSLYIFYF